MSKLKALAAAAVVITLAVPALPHCAAAQEEGVERDLLPPPRKPTAVLFKERPRVSVQPTSHVVQIESPIELEVRSSANGFAHLYVMSASGRTQLWMENVPIAGGQLLRFPTAGLSIVAAGPTGEDEVILLVTRKRIDGFLGRKTTRMPQLIGLGHEDFLQTLEEQMSALPRGEWNMARTSVEVVKSSGFGATWSSMWPWNWQPIFSRPSNLAPWWVEQNEGDAE
jgi:hypothetical protein